MKSFAALAIILSSMDMVLAVRQHGQQQVMTMGDRLRRSPIPGLIPGGSPLQHCDKNTTNDLFQIDSFTMTPSEPLGGHPIRLTAHGNFTRDIDFNAHVEMTMTTLTYHGTDRVMFELWRAVSEFKPDEASDELRLSQPGGGLSAQDRDPPASWPPKKGGVTLIEEGEVPWWFYYKDELFEMVIEGLDEDGRRLFCLMGFVVFNPSKEDS